MTDSLKLFKDICLQLDSLLTHRKFPHICCSSVVVSFFLWYVFCIISVGVVLVCKQPTNNLFTAIKTNTSSNQNIANNSGRLPEKPYGSMNWSHYKVSFELWQFCRLYYWQYTYSVFECRSGQGQRLFKCSASEISPESNESNVNIRASSQSRHSDCSKCNNAAALQIQHNICTSEEEKFTPDLMCCLTNSIEVQKVNDGSSVCGKC